MFAPHWHAITRGERSLTMTKFEWIDSRGETRRGPIVATFWRGILPMVVVHDATLRGTYGGDGDEYIVRRMDSGSVVE